MDKPYLNLTLCEELTLSYVCEERSFNDPLEIFTNWFAELDLFYDELSKEEFNAIFTLCECVVDVRRSCVHSIRDRTYDETTLRTYILLYTNVKGIIYVVGSCESHAYLLNKASMEDFPFSEITEACDFLNDLSRQKISVSNEVTHLFATTRPNVVQLAPIERYKEVLGERFSYINNNMSDIEFLSSRCRSTFEHAVYMYLCFAASVSGRLVDKLVQMEVTIFRRTYSELKDVPWIRHEFVRRYLGVDWEGVQTHFYRDIFIIPMDNTLPLYDSALYSTEHCYTDRAYADFFVKVPALYSPMTSQFHCAEHNNSCTSKLSLDKGRHIVPYGLLEDCAVKALEKQVRSMCAKISRLYCTHEALSTWMEKVDSEAKFALLRISEEPDQIQESYANSRMVSDCASQWYKRLQLAKDNPEIVCAYDKEIIETTIIPFWESVTFLRYNERLDRLCEGREVKQSTPGEYSFDQPTPLTYDELVQFAANYWSPCMNHLVHMCKGSHLEYRRRIIVVRFLISPVLGYSLEQAAAMWELFWKESDAYLGEGNFWSTSSEHAVTFKSFYGKDREQWKYWPTCKEMVSRDLCPFAVNSDVIDIEESVSPIKQRQRKCSEHVKGVLSARGRQTKFRDPKIYSPISYTACTNASYEV